MQRLTVSFRLVRETKNALRYEELDAKGNLVGCLPSGAVSPTAEIGMIYLRKAAIKGEPHPTITVTVEGI